MKTQPSDPIAANLPAEAEHLAHLGSWAYDVATHTLTLSEEMFRIFGIAPQDFDGSYETFFDRIHPDDRATVRAAHEQAIRDDTPHDGIHRIVRQSDGAIRFVRDTCKHDKDAGGRIARVVGIAHDLTDRVRVEQTLERERLRYKMLTSAYRDGIAIINHEHQVIEANARFAEMHGYAPEEVLGLHTWDWEAVMGEQEIRAQFVDLAATNVVFETRHRRKDGTLFDVEVSACGARVGDDAMVFAVSRDITQRKRVEQELRQYRERLEELVQQRTAELTRANRILRQEIAERALVEEELRQAKELAEDAQHAAEAGNRAKSEFLANMSHEIRTPLNAVLGFADILENLVTDAQQRNYLTSLKRGGWNLLALINDILDLSNIDSGTLKLAPEPTNLRALVNDVAGLFQAKIAEKGVHLCIDLDPGLPDYVSIDGRRLRQALFHLLSNAVKFTAAGTITVSAYAVATSGVRTGDPAQPQSERATLTLGFDVEDSGIGIPDDQRQRIFDAFTQLDARKNRKYGGTGLGLTITKRVIDLMNGTMMLSSTVGQGSRFTILLPRAPIAPAPPQDALATPDAGIDASVRSAPPRPATALPPALLASLERAAIEGDVADMDAVLSALRGHDAGLADALTALAENFEYGEILAWMRECLP